MRYTLIVIMTSLVFSSSLCFSQSIRLSYYLGKPLCDSSNIDLRIARPTIVKSVFSADSLLLVVRARGNCQNDNYGAIRIDGDTLNLLFIPKGIRLRTKKIILQDGYKPAEGEVQIALCDCYLEMKYAIVGVKKMPLALKVNGLKVYSPKEIYPKVKPTYETYGGKMVNLTDSIGHKQGRWIETNEDHLVVSEFFYTDDRLDSLIDFTYMDTRIRKTRSESLNRNLEIETEYYPSGKIKQECRITIYIATPYTVVDSRLKGRSLAPKIRTCFSYSEDGIFTGLNVAEEKVTNAQKE